MIRSNKRITKALIRLRGCAGWSAPVLFQNPEDRFFRNEAHIRISLNLAYDTLHYCTVIIFELD